MKLAHFLPFFPALRSQGGWRSVWLDIAPISSQLWCGAAIDLTQVGKSLIHYAGYRSILEAFRSGGPEVAKRQAAVCRESVPRAEHAYLGGMGRLPGLVNMNSSICRTKQGK